MDIRRPLLVVLALGAAASLYAFGGKGHRPHGAPPRNCPCDSARGAHERASLTPEQQTFLQAERRLRDSLHQAVRVYADSVRHGALARDLPTHRARIDDLARRLERLRTDNLDVWLDVMASRPLEPRRHGRRGRGPCRGPEASVPPPEEAPSHDVPPPDAD
jgi:hypothetical protein